MNSSRVGETCITLKFWDLFFSFKTKNLVLKKKKYRKVCQINMHALQTFLNILFQKKKNAILKKGGKKSKLHVTCMIKIKSKSNLYFLKSNLFSQGEECTAV